MLVGVAFAIDVYSEVEVDGSATGQQEQGWVDTFKGKLQGKSENSRNSLK